MESVQPTASKVTFQMLAQALESINDAVTISNANDEFVYINPAFRRLYGYAPADVLGKKASALWSDKNDPELTAEILPTTLEKGLWSGELYNRTQSGAEIFVTLTTSKVVDEAGNLVALVGVAHDTTEKKRHEEQMLAHNLMIAERNASLYEELNYARRLQRAMLPTEDHLKKIFPEAFVLLQAKHVLSGEFVWHYQQMDRTFFALVHTGVSGAAGAFLSVLIHNLLTQTVKEELTIAPNEVVAKVGERLQDLWTTTAMDEPLLELIQQQIGSAAVETVRTKSVELTLKQLRGVFCSFTKNFRAMRYTCIGVHAQLNRKGRWQVLDQEPADLFSNTTALLNPASIGSHQLPLQLGDTLYFYTEGILQQCGPKNPTPYGETQLIGFLGASQHLNLEEQKRQLEANLRLHRTGAHCNEDMLVVGARF